jgi:hypothetical protein
LRRSFINMDFTICCIHGNIHGQSAVEYFVANWAAIVASLSILIR